MNYVTTKEQCAALIHGVCRGCGNQLGPIETEDNAGNPTFWSGCLACSRFDTGVDPRVFETARRLFDYGYRHYSHIVDKAEDDHADRAYKKSAQLQGTCGLVVDVLREYEMAKPSAEKGESV